MRKLLWNSIKTSSEFRQVKNKGEKIVTSTFIAFILNEKDQINLGIIASKKIGCAVKRNRAKRILRAAFSKVSKDFQNKSVVLIARSLIFTINHDGIIKSMESMVPNI